MLFDANLGFGTAQALTLWAKASGAVVRHTNFFLFAIMVRIVFLLFVPAQGHGTYFPCLKR